MVSLIAAVSKNGVIGDKGKLPWDIPREMELFKAYTINQTVIMGRKTWESLGKKKLPQRYNIVISRNSGLKKDIEKSGCEFAPSLIMAIDKAIPYKETFVIGGADIYNLALSYVNKLYLSHIDIEIDGDTKCDWLIEKNLKDTFYTGGWWYHNEIEFDTSPPFKFRVWLPADCQKI